MNEALLEWKTARAAACEVGVKHPEYIDRLTRLANAEDTLQRLARLEDKPAAFEVLDHVNGTYVTTNEQAALATEFPYNGLYRRVGALKP